MLCPLLLEVEPREDNTDHDADHARVVTVHG